MVYIACSRNNKENVTAYNNEQAENGEECCYYPVAEINLSTAFFNKGGNKGKYCKGYDAYNAHADVSDGTHVVLHRCV